MDYTGAHTAQSGRYRTRTDDLFRVKEARYQLRQSPFAPDYRMTTEWSLRVDHRSRARGVWFCLRVKVTLKFRCAVKIAHADVAQW